MVAAQCHVKEMSAKKQGAPHITHIKLTMGRLNQTRSWGTGLPGCAPSGAPAGFQGSSMVSLDDHSNYTTTELMQWDQPTLDHSGGSGDIEVMEVEVVPSDEEMGSSGEEPEGHTQDSSLSSSESDADTKSGEGSDHDSAHYSDHGSSFGSDRSSQAWIQSGV